jgi:DNA topoisomerase-1
VAQQLYEGVELGEEGSVGLITYMRTDSLRVSAEAQGQAKEYILQRYGPSYYPESTRQFKAKGSVQDAHEAIRPTNVLRTPEEMRGKISTDQYRLYRLIWGRFVASQMAAAVYSSVTIDTQSAGHVFRSTRSSLKFAGYTAVYEESRDDENEEKQQLLPAVVEGDNLLLRDIRKEQKFTQPTSRYTEATLIKAMEETGVGRPSTYAPTVSTILDREYVVKEGRFLRPTPLGTVVTGLMKERFAEIVDLKFTARMETELDSVENGEKNWKSVLSDFYGPFNQSLEQAEKALEGERIKIPDEETDEICDVCGRKMVIKSGRFGRFLACPGYPECSFTKPLVIEMPGKCPRCGARILKRTSKNGYTYYACEKGAACGFMTWDVPTKENCPECGMTMFKKSGRGFNKPFCINETCSKFVPPDQRGYKKKTPVVGDGEKTDVAQTAETAVKEKKAAGSKTGTKKTSAKKAGTRKSTTRKTTAKKGTTGKQTREKK